MPTYEYACDKCEREFEAEQRITDDPIKTCPHCRSRKVKRLISKTSFVLKGGGWYSDLYGSSGKGGKSEGGDGGSKDPGGGDSAPAAKSDGSADAKSESSAPAKPAPASDSSGGGGGKGKKKSGSGAKAAA